MTGDDHRSESDESPDGSGDPPAVRIRGIYTTALTRSLLDAGQTVVQASAPIRERFDADFGDETHDVTVATTEDRQGVGVHGDPDAVDRVADELREVGRDTFAWVDPTPPGAVFEAEVTETLGSGAVCALGDAEGFLPYAESDDYLDAGDRVRVQVRESAPPWADHRAELGTDIRADAGLATLVRGGSGVTVDTRDDTAGRELAGMTEFLSTTVPDGWGLEWSHAATRADMDALDAALARAVARAESLSDALGDAGDGDTPPADAAPTGALAAPTSGQWCWFGRESRFALDDTRRAVTATMPGHHRTKAGSEAASAGVDLAEALCGDGLGGPSGDTGDADSTNDGDGDADSTDDGNDTANADETFPFAVVTRQFGPVEGDTVAITHGKPDGRAFSLGRGTVTEWDSDGTVAVERTLSGGGTYDALGTSRERGDTALTKFREGRWWYPTIYRGEDGDLKGTYVNVCTPVECFPAEIRYVDLHVDVIKHPDGTVERVDDDELDAAVAAGTVPDPVAEKARAVAASLERALSE